MFLLIVALFGLLVTNGIFIYWMFTEFDGAAGVLDNKLALGFIIEAFLVMFLFAYWFAKNPIGQIRWYWFIVLSLIRRYRLWHSVLFLAQ